jgi:hypothetical protein
VGGKGEGQRKTYSGVGAMVGGAGGEEEGTEMRLARQKDQQVQRYMYTWIRQRQAILKQESSSIRAIIPSCNVMSTFNSSRSNRVPHLIFPTF